MRIVLAPDSFKESMTAMSAARAMERGVHDAVPSATCALVPMSDGGEGFVDAIATAWGADRVTTETVNALGRPICATYALAGEKAVLDLASASGIELIAPADRDPARSNTYGLGLLVRDALSRGARDLLIGIGGSATNDAGAGMLVALGVRLLGSDGKEVAPLPLDLARVEKVEQGALDSLLEGVTIRVASDVRNPLTGDEGATAIFGPQKGVHPSEVPVFDEALAHFARVSGFDKAAKLPGSGAAGGVGFALRAFLGAELVPGLDLVAETCGLEAEIRGADLVLTGEGKVDGQTASGKVPAGVAAIAHRAGVPVVVFAGVVAPGAEALYERGVEKIVAISDPDVPLEENLRSGPDNLRQAVAQALATR